MATIHLTDRYFPLDDAIATDDEKLIHLLTPYYPQVVDSEIMRQSQEDSLHVHIIKPTSPETGLKDRVGGQDIAVEEKFQSQPTSTILPDTLHYKAVGWVRGQYIPSVDDFTTGILLLEDGVVASANLLVSASRFLKNRKGLVESSQVWIVYPHTRPKDPPYFHFTIRGISLPESKAKLEDFIERVDSFQVDGLVTYSNNETRMLGVRIYRNIDALTRPIKSEEKDNFFLLTITGVLPGEPYGQFWSLRLTRKGEQLVLEESTLVAQVFPPKKPKKNTKKQRRSKRKAKSKTPQ
ncbi:MAG TPA: hypothetical protein DD379_18540 [Cyanobacteria bacterium UBA11162]|nr:hypothetical protein [Cyanobacteria bacterium UBA11162]